MGDIVYIDELIHRKTIIDECTLREELENITVDDDFYCHGHLVSVDENIWAYDECCDLCEANILETIREEE